MSTRWLDAEELATWVRLVAVTELLPSTLDQQLRRDASLTHFEYLVLAMLSEDPGHTLQMSALAQRTNATLPRLSHVVRRLEDRGFVDRTRNSTDARATNAHLTEAGLAHLVDTAPGHVEIVREKIFDVLTPEQVTQLGAITTALLDALDPEGRMTGHTIGSHRPSSKE